MILGAGLVALALAGTEAAGRVALRIGWDSAAARLLTDPGARGVALYRAGNHAAADRAFADAGRSQTYNRALSLAATGNYPLSVAYFDAVLFVNPADEEARRNRDIVSAMYPPHRGSSVAPGRLAATGGDAPDDEVITDALANAVGPEWQRPIDARGLAASAEWLETLADDPGEFLRLRILAEYDRRSQLGLIRPPEGDPW